MTPIVIPNVLTSAEVSAALAALVDADWRDGRETAKGRANDAKRNNQATTGDVAARGVIELSKKRLLDHPVFQAAARPDRFARVLVSRYRAGDAYGQHVDAAYIDGARTDVSFTLFLTGAEQCVGGALLIEGEEPVAPTAGACIVYPSDRLHEVAPVAGGERLAIVGWVRSRIRSVEDRTLLFELDRVIADLDAASAPTETRDRLANLRNNLLRRFGD